MERDQVTAMPEGASAGPMTAGYAANGWREEQHKRDNRGEFSSGGSSAGGQGGKTAGPSGLDVPASPLNRGIHKVFKQFPGQELSASQILGGLGPELADVDRSSMGYRSPFVKELHRMLDEGELENTRSGRYRVVGSHAPYQDLPEVKREPIQSLPGQKGLFGDAIKPAAEQENMPRKPATRGTGQKSLFSAIRGAVYRCFRPRALEAETERANELKDRFSRAFAASTLKDQVRRAVERYAMPTGAPGHWEEGKHPRANDGRFGSKPGEHSHDGGPQQKLPNEGSQKPAPQGQPAQGSPQNSSAGNAPAAPPATARSPMEGAPQVNPEQLAQADAPLEAEPSGPEDMPRYFAAIEAHPYFQEASRRLEAAAAETKSKRVEFWSKEKHSDEAGNYTPERKALHQKILGQMLNPNATQKRGKTGKPVAVLLMGPPGSGKTTAGQPAVAQLGMDPQKDFTIVNADDAKAALPEYKGWNAGLLHEESSDLAEGQLLPEAMKRGHNALLDLTGSNAAKMAQLTDELSQHGYEVHMVQTKLPSHKTTYRAWQRFRQNAFGSSGDPKMEPGRFVPPRYVFASVDGKPDKTYAELKNHPSVQSWRQVSTDVPKGQAPILLDIGQR